MQESISLRRYRNFTDSLPAFVFDPSLDAKKRSKMIEKEMNEQAKYTTIYNPLVIKVCANSGVEGK